MEKVWGEVWVQSFKTVSMGIKVETSQTQQPIDHHCKE